jgi:hypothetical protein
MVALFWEALEALGREANEEEVGHWGWTFEDSTWPLFLFSSLLSVCNRVGSSALYSHHHGVLPHGPRAK